MNARKAKNGFDQTVYRSGFSRYFSILFIEKRKRTIVPKINHDAFLHPFDHRRRPRTYKPDLKSATRFSSSIQGIEIRVLGRRGRGTDVPANAFHLDPSLRRIPTRTALGLPLFRIDSSSRAPLESFPGAAWPRMPGKLAPMLDYAAILAPLATRVQPEWPSIFNASARNSPRASFREHAFRKTKV